MTVRILTGDCRDVLRSLPSESVHCVVTSPPYWGLRDYGVDGQLGLEPSPAEYVAEMVDVFRAVRRVLRDDGTLWLNLGDSYAGSGKGGSPEAGKQATNKGSQTIGVLYGTGKTAREAAVTNVTRRTHEIGMKPKDLIGIPWRVAFALQADGWYLRQDIIWSKPNPMPESVTDRCTKAHEYLFLLSKSKQYFYDAVAIKEDSVTPDIRRPYGSPGANALDGRENPQGQGQPRKTKFPNGWEYKLGAHGTIHREGRTETRYVETDIGTSRNKRSVWTVSTSPFPEAHFATFPPALIDPCIKAGCPAGGTVLDPFGGAGTTGLVADRLGRNAVLIEINPEYAAMAERRIQKDAGVFANVTSEEHPKPLKQEALEL